MNGISLPYVYIIDTNIYLNMGHVGRTLRTRFTPPPPSSFFVGPPLRSLVSGHKLVGEPPVNLHGAIPRPVVENNGEGV